LTVMGQLDKRQRIECLAKRSDVAAGRHADDVVEVQIGELVSAAFLRQFMLRGQLGLRSLKEALHVDEGDARGSQSLLERGLQGDRCLEAGRPQAHVRSLAELQHHPVGSVAPAHHRTRRLRRCAARCQALSSAESGCAARVTSAITRIFVAAALTSIRISPTLSCGVGGCRRLKRPSERRRSALVGDAHRTRLRPLLSLLFYELNCAAHLHAVEGIVEDTVLVEIYFDPAGGLDEAVSLVGE